MASKGFNSILFDIDSIIDLKISTLLYIKKEYANLIDPNASMDIESLQFRRCFGTTDIFEDSIIPEYKNNTETLYDFVNLRDFAEIAENAHITNISNLLSAYLQAGDGTIRTAVYCDNSSQADVIRKKFPWVAIEEGGRDKVDMGKYGRLVSGSWQNAIKYNLDEPKSILVVNFRDNFTDHDITLLRPELVIRLGDIHDIQVISAYNTPIDEIPAEG